MKFYAHLSRDPGVAASGVAGGVALGEKTEVALLDSVLIDSRICAMRLRSLFKWNIRYTDRRNVFVFEGWTITVRSADKVSGTLPKAARSFVTSNVG